MKRIAETAAVLLIALASGAQALTTLTVDTTSADGEPGADGKYSKLWEAYNVIPNPFDDDYVINCSGATDDVNAVAFTKASLNGATPYTLTINGDNTTGIFDDAKYQLVFSTAVTGLNLSDASDRVTFHQLQISGGALPYTALSPSNNCDGLTVTNSLFRNFTRASPYGNALYVPQSDDVVIRNNVIYNCTTGICLLQSETVACQNNTIAEPLQYGIYTNRNYAADMLIQNNLIKGAGTADWYEAGSGGTFTTATNFTSDATSPDEDCGSRTITFVSESGSFDYHLADAMNQKMKGVDLSGSFSTDVDGETRGWWDPGFDEISDASQPWSRGTDGGLNEGLNEGLN